MIALLQTIGMVLGLFKFLLIIMIIMSWLFTFNIINGSNQFVAGVWRVINAITEPVLAPIRRILPNMGGIDLSPIVVFILIFFLESFISNDLPRMLNLY